MLIVRPPVQWYDIRLLKNTDASPTSEFAYNSQRDWVIKAFAYAGIQSNKSAYSSERIVIETLLQQIQSQCHLHQDFCDE